MLKNTSIVIQSAFHSQSQHDSHDKISCCCREMLNWEQRTKSHQTHIAIYAIIISLNKVTQSYFLSISGLHETVRNHASSDDKVSPPSLAADIFLVCLFNRSCCFHQLPFSYTHLHHHIINLILNIVPLTPWSSSHTVGDTVDGNGWTSESGESFLSSLESLLTHLLFWSRFSLQACHGLSFLMPWSQVGLGVDRFFKDFYSSWTIWQQTSP